MVGAGSVNPPARFGTATGRSGAIVGRILAGTGMDMLARSAEARVAAPQERRRDAICASVATIRVVCRFVVAGLETVIPVTVPVAPGTLPHLRTRRGQRVPLLPTSERGGLVVGLPGATAGVCGLATGLARP